MPVNTLLVEGELDAQVLGAILDGVRVVRRGPKGSLAPETRRFREVKTVTACYLRDRDFDYDPPSTGASEPTVDRLEGGSVLGWRWCRHEIENYLIEPDLVVVAMGWDRSEFSAQVIEAARSIRHYQIARWVIGRARSGLPPHHELETRPPELKNNEYRLPRDFSEEALFQWVRKHIGDFSSRVQTSLSDEAVAASLSALGSVLTDALFSSSSAALLWCSGKDLLAALGPWLQARQISSAKVFVNLMRDWVVEHPAESLQRIPEWASLLQLVRA